MFECDKGYKFSDKGGITYAKYNSASTHHRPIVANYECVQSVFYTKDDMEMVILRNTNGSFFKIEYRYSLQKGCLIMVIILMSPVEGGRQRL